jgi:hypothetical protein
MIVKKETLLVAFREDSLTRISRQTLSDMCNVLGFDQTQTVHLALARLREDVLGQTNKPIVGGDYSPLTSEQEAAIRRHKPKIGKGWKKLTSQSLF